MIPKFIKHSLSAKLLLLFIAAGGALILVVATIMSKGFSTHFRSTLQPFVVHYIEMVEQDLGYPPKLEQAQIITSRIPVDIHVFGPDQNWSTGAQRLNPKELRRIDDPHPRLHDEHRKRKPPPGKRHRPFERFQLKRIGEGMILRARNEPYDIYFQLHHQRDINDGGPYSYLILLSILAILLGIFYATRWLFKPIQDIRQGVNEFSRGNFTHRIKQRRDDQLGELAGSVNDMASDIEAMLEAKRQLLLGISHELRSPLTRTKVNVALLPESIAQKEIHQDINYMEQLITELLESERLNSRHAVLQSQWIQLDELIKQVLDSQVGHGDEDNLLIRDLTDTKANVDPGRIKLLVSNLVQNAITHTSKPHQSQVHTTHDSAKAKVIVKLEKDSETFTISVQDFGAGIEAAHIPYLTEPFYRADPSRQRKTGGYGLGLYLCKMIAKAHGGDLTIESVVNKGTTIRCHIPLNHELQPEQN